MCRSDRRCDDARRLRSISSSDLAPDTDGAPSLSWAGEDMDELWSQHDADVACAALKRLQAASSSDARVFFELSDAADSAGVRLHGTSARLKAPSSLARKIEAKQNTARLQGRPPLSAEGAVGSITDVSRYTVLAEDHDQIVDAARAVVQRLRTQGWEVHEAEHSYVEGSPYKGIHVQLRDPDGQTVELQIHSRQSQEIKDQSHLLYEQSRAIKTPLSERRRLNLRSAELWASLPAPRDIEELTELGGATVRKIDYSAK